MEGISFAFQKHKSRLIAAYPCITIAVFAEGIHSLTVPRVLRVGPLVGIHNLACFQVLILIELLAGDAVCCAILYYDDSAIVHNLTDAKSVINLTIAVFRLRDA